MSTATRIGIAAGLRACSILVTLLCLHTERSLVFPVVLALLLAALAMNYRNRRALVGRNTYWVSPSQQNNNQSMNYAPPPGVPYNAGYTPDAYGAAPQYPPPVHGSPYGGFAPVSVHLSVLSWRLG